METTIMGLYGDYRVYIGIMEKKNGNYHIIVGILVGISLT